MNYIRGKAIVILEKEGKFLFTICYEHVQEKVFYIPVGGGIEFGEHSIDAAKREVLEETGEEIENVKLIDTSENIFSFNGIKEHEIVFIYSAGFKDKSAYKKELRGRQNDKGEEIKLVWASLYDIAGKNINLYPPGLLPLLGNLKL